MAESDESEYILGTDPRELERLGEQHAAWVSRAYALFERAGLGPDQRVLDLGSGPGFTSFELARVVGPGGSVIARDVSARFLAFLEAEAERLRLPWIETSLGPLEGLDLEPGSIDAAYSRWVYSWLEDASAGIAPVARALAPGGALLLQEYLAWGSMKLLPREPAFDRAVEACLESWRVGGATIDVAEDIPELARGAGLRLEHFEPIARFGAPGSLVWRWADGFFHGYLPRLIEQELFGAADFEAFQAVWRERAASGHGVFFAPVLAEAILRKS